MKKKILIVDDETIICKTLKKSLEATGKYDVTVAFDGEQGINEFKKNPFDLVITDFHMPKMGGAGVLAHVKKTRPDVPVFLFSVFYDDHSEITHKIADQADGILTKPFKVGELHEKIEKSLGA